MRYHEVRFKASHNSFQRREQPVTEQLHWDPHHPYQKSGRGVELDLVQHKNRWRWRVKHDQPYANRCIVRFRFPPFKQNNGMELRDHLEQLNKWSEEHPGHDVITVHLDLKNAPLSHEEFAERLDSYLLRVIPENKIFAPAALMEDGSDLVTAAMARGWPKLGELQGKFIFCLTGKDEERHVGERKKLYADSDAKNRLCFVDQSMGDGDGGHRPPTDQGNRVFFNYNIFSGKKKWRETMKWFSRQHGFVTRGYVANNKKLWELAVAHGVNVIATDRVSNYEWARVGKQPFEKISS